MILSYKDSAPLQRIHQLMSHTQDLPALLKLMLNHRKWNCCQKSLCESSHSSPFPCSFTAALCLHLHLWFANTCWCFFPLGPPGPAQWSSTNPPLQPKSRSIQWFTGYRFPIMLGDAFFLLVQHSGLLQIFLCNLRAGTSNDSLVTNSQYLSANAEMRNSSENLVDHRHLLYTLSQQGL